ncbi:hypothetical protein MVEN_02509900 [Mycena venus]|uniref:F-box domain-containing protein n=1 Tax=Mycena venus TaxID=2733690 RepID=A0A8H6U573_9AGAR|nr:hypothetical protein MVEN_02509900 [Mycena venus]
MKIRGRRYGLQLSAVQVFELLRAAPNLVECILEGIHPMYEFDALTENVVLPSLHHLIFGKFGHKSDDDFLKFLTLPRAAHPLHIDRYVSADDLLSFLKRSSPPLRDMFVGKASAINFVQLHDCLGLVPTLTRFEVWWPDSALLASLFAALADIPSFLPNLRSLALNLHPSQAELTPSFWEAVLRALSVRRRSELQMAYIKLHVFTQVSLPAASIRAAFKELVADGMQIHIDTGALKLIFD